MPSGRSLGQVWAEAGPGGFPFPWTSELLFSPGTAPKDPCLPGRLSFLLNKNQTFGINIWIPFSSF